MSEQADMGGLGCDEFAGVAAELALGVLTGRERAAALAHLDGCEACREQVRELTMTGEELLSLLPSREPPAGFETRVLDRLGLTDGPAPYRPPNRPRNRMRNLLAAAAVVVALVVAGVGGWGLRAATGPSTAGQSAITTAALVTSSHQMVGQAFVYTGSPWWMYMSVSLDGVGDITVQCELENAAGHFKSVGTFRLNQGYGTWGSPYALGGTIVGARLVAADGTVLATASFG